MKHKFNDRASTELVEIMASDPAEQEKNPLSVHDCLVEVLSFRRLLDGLSALEKEMRRSSHSEYACDIRRLIAAHEADL